MPYSSFPNEYQKNPKRSNQSGNVRNNGRLLLQEAIEYIQQLVREPKKWLIKHDLIWKIDGNEYCKIEEIEKALNASSTKPSSVIRRRIKPPLSDKF